MNTMTFEEFLARYGMAVDASVAWGARQPEIDDLKANLKKANKEKPMDFEEWSAKYLAGTKDEFIHETVCKLISDDCFNEGKKARQQEVDELKMLVDNREGDYLEAVGLYESVRKTCNELYTKNAELESRCKQLQGLVDEIAHKYIMQHFDYDLNERLQLSATKREATCKQSLQDQSVGFTDMMKHGFSWMELSQEVLGSKSKDQTHDSSEAIDKLLGLTEEPNHIHEVGKMVEKSCENCRFEHEDGDCVACYKCEPVTKSWQPKETK